jgi:hypothetical protein
MFFMLMVGVPGSPSAPARGPIVDIFYVDGGHSRISISIHQGAHHRRFLVLMVSTPRSTAPKSPKGSTVGIFYVDGGRSQISVSTRQGACHRCFLALMVGAPGSPAPAPPRGPAVNVSYR